MTTCPQWDEIILRLQHRRPDWDWQANRSIPTRSSKASPADRPELAVPASTTGQSSLPGTRSPFTYGLETELRKLAQLDDEAVRDTALGLWLRGGAIESPAARGPVRYSKFCR